MEHNNDLEAVKIDIKRESRLTMSLCQLKSIVLGANQPTPSLVSTQWLPLLSVAVYLVSGIFFYSSEEGWSVVDCIYYCLVIITTVGYGDLTPTTQSSKLFTVFFALFGIGMVGYSLGSLMEWFLARQKASKERTSKKMLQDTADAADCVVNGKKKSKASDMEEQLSSEMKSILRATIPFFAALMCGIIIGYFEDWGFVDSLYMTVITVTTIGFGDFSPHSMHGRILAIFYLPVAVISVANAIGNIAELIVNRNVVREPISIKELIQMDVDGDGKVSQVEYLSYMLIKLGKVNQDEIDQILAQFNKIDADNSGYLDRNDLVKLDEHLNNFLEISGQRR